MFFCPSTKRGGFNFNVHENQVSIRAFDRCLSSDADIGTPTKELEEASVLAPERVVHQYFVGNGAWKSQMFFFCLVFRLRGAEVTSSHLAVGVLFTRRWSGGRADVGGFVLGIGCMVFHVKVMVFLVWFIFVMAPSHRSIRGGNRKPVHSSIPVFILAVETKTCRANCTKNSVSGQRAI